MKEKLLKILGGALASGILGLVIFLPIAVIALLGGGLMGVFGFRYDSVGQLILYFVAAAVIGFPLGLFSAGLPRALYHMKWVSRRGGNLLYIPLDTLCSFFSFWLADLVMEGVSATSLAIWVISFALAVVDLPLKRDEERPSRP